MEVFSHTKGKPRRAAAGASGVDTQSILDFALASSLQRTEKDFAALWAL
jgi:hypothetical protein